MTYCDAAYLAIFLPLTVILYNLMPQKHRPKVLLIASYLFFWIISKKLIIYIILSTFSIHHFGLWLTSIQQERNELLKEAEKSSKKDIRQNALKKQRKVLITGCLIHIGLLFMLKYMGFVENNLNNLLSSLNLHFSVNVHKFMMPIGISFYTLQAVSYMIDVYHEKIKADRNIPRLALYLAFFPQIMEGPICRYSETAMQLWEGKKITYDSFKSGLIRLGYGMMKKMLIADRVNMFVKEIFSNYEQLDGGIIALGAIFYTIQLYMDFSGTMDMVIGSSEIFGITLPENFKQPFFSKNISEFWTRWHITLGAFFRDYIFYPLSLSEPLKKLTTKGRKKLGKHYGPLLASSVALFCVWFCNGLWHGAAWSFIFFGMYHFALILSGKFFEPQINWVINKLHLNRENRIYKVFQILRTTLLVCIGELFFRAEGLKAGFIMFGKMITQFSLEAFKNGQILKQGLDKYDFYVLGITLVLVFIISILKEKNVDIREKISKKNIVVRWTIYYIIIFSIIIFGAYGYGYVPVDPMYANF